MIENEHRIHFREILQRDRGVCRLCNKKIKDYFDMTLDHILARGLGGNNSPENLQLAHYRCNQNKHIKIEIPLMRRLSAQKERG